MGMTYGGLNMKTGKNDAVSPVIAVILMVAITVVLAAVLYVMVSGLVDDDVSATKAFAATSEKKAGYWKVEITLSAVGLFPQAENFFVFFQSG